MSDLSTAVGDLAKDFSGRVLLPADAPWDDARRIHNGLVDKRPAVIAQCAGSADIASAVRLAREHSLEIAVRGGGHNVGGRATVHGGMMIDLSLLKYAHVDGRARKARVLGTGLVRAPRPAEHLRQHIPGVERNFQGGPDAADAEREGEERNRPPAKRRRHRYLRQSGSGTGRDG